MRHRRASTIAVCVTITVCAFAIAWLNRYDIVAVGGGGSHRLDRWTGGVHMSQQRPYNAVPIE